MWRESLQTRCQVLRIWRSQSKHDGLVVEMCWYHSKVRQDGDTEKKHEISGCDCLISKPLWSLASLGLVSPGAATDGVTHIFSLKNWRPFLVIALWLFLAVEPVVSSPLPPSDVVYPVSFLNPATKNNFSRVSRPWRVSPGRSAPSQPLVTPLVMVHHCNQEEHTHSRNWNRSRGVPSCQCLTRVCSPSFSVS